MGRARAKKQIPQRLRGTVLERDGYQCLACATQHRLTMDHHPVPERDLPDEHALQASDLRVLCHFCNCISGTRSMGLAEIRLRRAALHAPVELARWQRRHGSRPLSQIELQLILGQNPVADLLREASCRFLAEKIAGTSETKRVTLAEAAVQVLEAAGVPLRSRELTERIFRVPGVIARSPSSEHAVRARLSREARSSSSSIERVSRGLYALR